MIFQKETAVSLLQDTQFLGAWDRLWQNCPWATVFQHQDFVITWFQHYPIYQPLLVTDWDGKALSGVLVLTFQDKDVITGAGLDQAEYQTWLSYSNSGDEFISSSIEDLVKEFPRKVLHLKYLPSQTPLSWLKNFSPLKNHFFLKEHDQPLMRLNKDQLELELKKKNRKEKINRLKRIGNLQLDEISSVFEFEKVIDEMILQNDFRKGAIYGKMFFQKEPQRKDFLLKMFELGHLHVSLLKLNETIIASNAGFITKEIVHLQGINSHSPFFSKYSPGILHFLFLGINLFEIKKKYFDLTPGGKDGYKSILANESETVHELLVSSKILILKKNKEEKIKNWLKELTEKFPFIKSLISILFSLLKNTTKEIAFRRLNKKVDRLNTVNALEKRTRYKYPLYLQNKTQKVGSNYIRRNYISDLIFFNENGISHLEFLSDCLRRIELGQQLFTIVEDDILQATIWIIPIIEKIEDIENKGEDCKRKSFIEFSYYKMSLKLLEILAIFSESLKIENENFPDYIEINSKQKYLLKSINKDFQKFLKD